MRISIDRDAILANIQSRPGVIPPVKLSDGQVGTKNIRDASITNAKIEDATITNAKIESLTVDKLTGGTLAADMVLGSKIATGQSGQRLELDSAGLRAFDSLENQTVDMGADGTVSIEGDLTANQLTVPGPASLQGATALETGATMSIASGGVSDPVGAPSMVVGWPTTRDFTSDNHWGMYYDAAGGAGGATPSFWSTRPASGGYYRYITEYDAATGASLREIDLGATKDAWGVCRLGSTIYVFFSTDDTVTWKIAKYSQSSLAYLGNMDVSSRTLNDNPGFFTDGTNLIVITTDSSSSSTARIRLVSYNTSGTYQSTLDLDAGVTVKATDVEFGGAVKLTEAGINGGAAVYWVSVFSTASSLDKIKAFKVSNGNVVNSGSDDFGGAAGGAVDGITHDGTNFWTLVWNSVASKHSNWITTNTYAHTRYIWYNNGSAQRSKGSADSTVTMIRRAFLSFTSAAFPGGVDRVKVHVASDNTLAPPAQTSANYKLQATVSTRQTSLSSFDSAGAAIATTNTFTGGTAAEVDATNFQLKGDGTGYWEQVGPSGMIVAYGASAAPSGWVLCDGASYLRSTYAKLFAVIGTTFGSVDGTHFNVPDLRQRFPLGLATSGTGNAMGATGGTIDHTHDAHTQTSVTPNTGANLRLHDPVTHSAVNPPFQVIQYIIRTGL